ncbi:MAG: hypothetical protein ABW098_19755 [Candidatus Thiodiazotropha sp.]
MKATTITAIVCELLLLSMTRSLLAGVSADTETRILTDKSRLGEALTSVEQWTSLYYQEIGGDLHMGLQFAVEVDEDDSAGQVYQSYIQGGDGIDQVQYTIGRFESIDLNGFYTLDGFSLAKSFDLSHWRIYAGRPRHLEAYAQEDADFLLGLDGHLDLLPDVDSEWFKKLIFNFGVERRVGESNPFLLHIGLTGEQVDLEQGPQLGDFQLAADIDLNDNSLSRVVIDSRFDLNTYGGLRLGYHHYVPDPERDTFRDRYHGVYNDKRHSVLRGVWYLPKMAAIESRLEVSGNSQEHGHGGQGIAAEAVYTTGYGPIVDARVDYLEMADDQVISTYLRYRHPITAFSKLELEGVLQKKETLLSDSNHLEGFSVSYSQRFLKQFTFALSGEWLDHSDREDEYRAAVSVRYSFYQVNTGELP